MERDGTRETALGSLLMGHRARHRRVFDGPEESVGTRCLRGPHCTIGVRTDTVTESHPTKAWREETVGRDRALVRSGGGVTMTFALGPATGAAREPDRLAAIRDHRVSQIRHCEQIHGRLIHEIIADGQEVFAVGPGDGLVTTSPGVGLLVWTADCVPVLLAADGIVAAIHSGWRGCAADIVGAGIEHMIDDHGISAGTIRAALGPAVCGSCYEVGPEVPRSLRPFDLDEARWLKGSRVDLRAFLTARLEALGVPAEQIETVGGCTVESPDLASFRRDGEAAGRQWAMIVLNR